VFIAHLIGFAIGNIMTVEYLVIGIFFSLQYLTLHSVRYVVIRLASENVSVRTNSISLPVAPAVDASAGKSSVLSR